MERYLKKQVLADLKEKMVFLAGPRQAGKTTLAEQIANANTAILNWDIDEDRERILLKQLPTSDLWIFDEIHKYRNWRNYLKGLYDKNRNRQKILVTGSARLDHYRRGGDSLQGRYHFLRLHPLSLAEVSREVGGNLKSLLELGPFPEPFLSGSKEKADRWSLQYRTRVVRQEVLSLETVSDIDLLQLMERALPDRVGSPLSLNNLRENLQVSFKSVKRWVEILENLYVIFRIRPFVGGILNAVKKEQKHYHYDWNVVQEEGARFENLIACHLQKWVHFEIDTRGRDLELCFFRNVEKQEVDFVIVERQKPILFVEAKRSGREIGDGLKYLKRKHPKVRALQVYLEKGAKFRDASGIDSLPADEFLLELV